MVATTWYARDRVRERTVSLVANSAGEYAKVKQFHAAFSQSSRCAFTLVELLVVVAVLGVVAGLLLPAVQAVRQSGYRTQCMDKQRVLGQAVAEYVLKRNHYPGWRSLLAWRHVEIDRITGKPTATMLQSPRPTPGSWVIGLLPYLDRPDLIAVHGEQGPTEPDGGTRGVSPNAYLDLLVCPVDTRATTVGGYAPLTACSYVANCGMKDEQRSVLNGVVDAPANGVFQNHFLFSDRPGDTFVSKPVRVTDTYIRSADGLSSTLLFSENVDAGNWGAVDRLETELGMLWWPTVEFDAAIARATPPRPTYTDLSMAGINQAVGLIDSFEPDHPDRQYFGRPSSLHGGGVVATFCDGSAKFLSDQLDYLTYCLLMTPDGRRAVHPGGGQPVHDLYRFTPLSEESY